MTGSQFRLKACPKCGGDMYEDSDGWGSFMKCLQCGHTKDVEADKRQGAVA